MCTCVCYYILCPIHAGQSDSGGSVNIVAIIISIVVIVVIVCISLPICCVCLTVALICTCREYRKARKRKQPEDDNVEATPQGSRVHQPPLPPIPATTSDESMFNSEMGVEENEAYDIIWSTEPRMGENEAYTCKSELPKKENRTPAQLPMIDNRAYNTVWNTEPPMEGNKAYECNYEPPMEDNKAYVYGSEPSVEANRAYSPTQPAEIPTAMDENVAYDNSQLS